MRAEVSLESRNGTLSALSGDLSEGGLFVRTDDRVPAGELVTMRLRMPQLPGELESLAVVRHSTSAADALRRNSEPGMGIQFYGLTPCELEDLRDMIRFASEQWSEFADGGVIVVPLAQPDVVRRQHRRFSGPFEVELPRLDRRSYHVHNVSVGGLLLDAPLSLPLRTQVAMKLTHPKDPAPIIVRGQVVRVQEAGPRTLPGVAIRFVDMVPNRRPAFERWIQAGADHTLRDLHDFIDDDRLGLGNLVESLLR